MPKMSPPPSIKKATAVTGDTAIDGLNPEKQPDNKTLVKERIKSVEQAAELDLLSEDQKNAAIDYIKLMSPIWERAHEPLRLDDGTLEMELMNGGKIATCVPTGRHVMLADQEMQARGEKNTSAKTQAVYTMVACSDIDGVPMTMEDIGERMSARDFTCYSTFFKSINLL